VRTTTGTILKITLLLTLALEAIPALAQLTERPLGYRFEESGFLSMPGVLAYDAGRHRLAIADKGARLIYIFDLTDKTYLTIGADRDLPEPTGMAFDSRGSLYVALDKTPYLLIYKFQADIPDTLNIISILPSELKKPSRIYIDHDGFKYLIDSDKNDIIIINPDNSYVRTISDKLKRPDGILMTNGGELIIADKGFDPILVFNPNFEFERRFTRPESPTSQFSYSASSLASDHRGWIYTLDITRNRVIIFDPTGVSETDWTPQNSAFFPVDIAIDRYDHIFIGDSGSGSVKTFVREN
jgi:streptogramin lyase